MESRSQKEGDKGRGAEARCRKPELFVHLPVFSPMIRDCKKFTLIVTQIFLMKTREKKNFNDFFHVKIIL